MDTNAKLVNCCKYAAYALLFLLLYVLQTTPGFLQIFGQKPQLLLPAAICVAMYEGEFAGGLYGAWAGILCDMAAPTLFGFYSLQLLVLCTGVGLAVIYYMKNNQLGALLLTAGALLYFSVSEYVLYYFMWGYDHSALLLLTDFLPRMVYSLLFVPVFYWLFGWSTRFFAQQIKT